MIQEVLARHHRDELPDYLLSRLATTVAARLQTTTPSTREEAERFLANVAELYRRNAR